MSQKIRRALAVATVLSALALALPAPAHAAALRHWQPTNVASWFWSWLQDLGLVPQAEKPAGGMEKEGSGINPDGLKPPGAAPTATSDEGSGVNPDGKP